MSAEVTSPSANSGPILSFPAPNTDSPVPQDPSPTTQPSISPVASTRRPVSLLALAGQWLAIFALAGGCYFLISHFLLTSVRVVGISMVPTLQDSQRYLLNRWVLYFRAPHRDDIVVLRDPADNGFSVKRVVAVGGDIVRFSNGRVYVNDRELQEPYLAPGTATFTSYAAQARTFTCSKDQYFVLGDNRPRSVDSRAYGPVPRANILGLIIR
jgi:signal peptidase I